MSNQISQYQQQAIDFAKKNNVKLTIIGSTYGKHFTDDKEERYIFKCMLQRNKKQYTFNFGQSLQAGAEEPNMYDVLTCLTKYDPYNFEDFCGDYGYDTDSRKAEKTYKAVQKEWESVERLFSDVLEELQEIQ